MNTTTFIQPRRATIDELALVHSHTYLLQLQEFCRKGGGWLDADTYAAKGSFDTAILAAGTGLEAVDILSNTPDNSKIAFIAMRPPGHHALREKAMGFCLINNIAVAAAYLANRGEKVLIFDFDVHHGNGTQEIFWNDQRVLYVSIHQYPFYPQSGTLSEIGGGKAVGLTVNIPLPAGTVGYTILNKLDEMAASAVSKFSPTWILVSAGFDGHKDDPLASFELIPEDFADIAAWPASVCELSNRTVLFLEGGYNIQALKMSVAATFARLCR